MASSVPRSRDRLHCSEYTKFLLGVSQNLTKEDMSNIKMILSCEKMLRPDVIEEIQFGGDLIRSMGNARLITDSSVRALGQMLRDVGRVDLAALASDYEDNKAELHDNNNVRRARTGTGRPEAQQHVDADGGCLPEDTELPMSAEECSPSSSQQSCVSMTDEEKWDQIENKKAMGVGHVEEFDSQDLFD